jgi:hypothetical protein
MGIASNHGQFVGQVTRGSIDADGNRGEDHTAKVMGGGFATDFMCGFELNTVGWGLELTTLEGVWS